MTAFFYHNNKRIVQSFHGKKKLFIILLPALTISLATFFLTRYYSVKKEVTVYFPDEIDLALAEYPVRGDPNAPVTIIELCDFECPYSKALQPTLDTLHDYLQGVIKHYFKPQIIFTGKEKRFRARAVLAAKRQGKYWEMKKALFSIDLDKKNKSFKKSILPEIIKKAKECNLDIQTFQKDFHSREISRELRSIIVESDKYGIDFVPTLFINGKIIQGKHGFEDYLDIIEKALAE